jgi:hypothetical protein
MTGKLGLVDLVEAACQRCLAGEQIVDWFGGVAAPAGELFPPGEFYQEAAERLARHIDARCRLGLFGEAIRLVRLEPASLPADIFSQIEQIDDMRSCPIWEELVGVCELADRVDNFLAILEQAGTAGQLARAVRNDLDLLLILADLCEETNQPVVAAEARHLHGLVRTAW